LKEKNYDSSYKNALHFSLFFKRREEGFFGKVMGVFLRITGPLAEAI
jgi:hypothetical protein